MRRYSKTEVEADALARLSAHSTHFRNKSPRRQAKAESARRHKLDQRLNAEQIAAIIAGYEAGRHSAELSREFGMSKTSVIKLLREAGVKIRRQGLTADQAAHAERLYLSGLSMERVANELGTRASTICFVLHQRSVPTRPRRGGR